MCALEKTEDPDSNLRGLVAILQLAYSGEKAAAYAYQGHWRSISGRRQRAIIRRIEREEWMHRAEVGRMLTLLNARPLWWREALMTMIGRTVSIGCFLIGWFFPMYLAGQLESDNVDEYDVAARYAIALGFHDMAVELHEMATTEREHENFFASMVLDHAWLPLAIRLFGWQPEVKAYSASANLLALCKNET